MFINASLRKWKQTILFYIYFLLPKREETWERVIGRVEEVVPVNHPEEARKVRLVVQLLAQLLQVPVATAAATAAAVTAAAAIAATAANGGWNDSYTVRFHKFNFRINYNKKQNSEIFPETSILSILLTRLLAECVPDGLYVVFQHSSSRSASTSLRDNSWNLTMPVGE